MQGAQSIAILHNFTPNSGMRRNLSPNGRVAAFGSVLIWPGLSDVFTLPQAKMEPVHKPLSPQPKTLKP